MQAIEIHHLELLLLFLMCLTAALAALARRFRTPSPIVLVVGGIVVSLFPNIPRVSLSPDLVFLVLLPPLLFAAAYQTSWRDFRSNMLGIFTLAFGLVGFTAVALAFLASWFLPGFDHRTGFVLGALVASTDAVAASAIAKRVGLPQKIIDLLEGESLVNDATALVALEFSVAMVVSNQVPTFSAGFLRLSYLVVVGLGVGLVAARVIRLSQTRLTDAPIEITLTLIAPYVAYVAAESMRASGVLATVACGLYLGHKRSRSLSMRARLDSTAVWNTLDFILNGLVFILIGLQLPHILAGIRGVSLPTVLLDGTLLVLMLIALRITWVFAESWIVRPLSKRLKGAQTPMSTKEIFIVGWTGMRGVISLAAAISLPEVLDDGSSFPQRNLLVFLTFSVIVITLVAQGLTLPPLIRKLNFDAANGASGERSHARRKMLQAAIREVRALRRGAPQEDREPLADLLYHYQQQLEQVDRPASTDDQQGQHQERARKLGIQLRAVERTVLLALRDENQINDQVLRTLEQELDLLDARHSSTQA